MSLIEVKGLRKSFDSLEVLKGVDLTVEQGERIAIIGGSGCGKSVFLRSLALLEKPDAGQIFIDGREITARGARVDEIRRSMGMVFQKFHLFSEMNVMDNLCLAPTRILKMPQASSAGEKKREARGPESAIRGTMTKADSRVPNRSEKRIRLTRERRSSSP